MSMGKSLDTGGRCACRSANVCVCVCARAHMGEGHISYEGGVCTWRCSVCVRYGSVCVC